MTNPGRRRWFRGCGVMGLLGLAASALAGCGDHDRLTDVGTVADVPDPPDVPNRPDVPDKSSALEGTWVSAGWKLALVAHAGVLQTYELTSVSCLPYAELHYDEGLTIPELGGTARFEQGELVIDVLGSAQLRASRALALPTRCDAGGTPLSSDPEQAFEAYWHNFDEMYSSFDLRKLDWAAQYAAYRSRITAKTTPEELLALLCEMVDPLDDPHVSLQWGEQSCASKELPSWLEGEGALAIESSLMDQVYGEGATLTATDLVAYRSLGDEIGYVFIPSMGGYAELPTDDEGVISAAIDEVVAAFSDMDAMVVDVRFNGGGSDAISLAIADRFADRKRLAFSAETRDGAGWTPLRKYYLEPAGPAQFTKPVIVLTSSFSVSSAEAFTMAMQALPNVIVLGETTAGGLSNMMLRNLPNGFEYSLPFERMFAADGICYEGVGITPDVPLPFDPEAFLAGDDTMLAAAIARLRR